MQQLRRVTVRLSDGRAEEARPRKALLLLVHPKDGNEGANVSVWKEADADCDPEPLAISA